MMSDYIVFWMKLNQMPVFTSAFDRLIYEMECGARQISDEMAKEIRPIVQKALANVFRKMADRIEITEKTQ